MTERAFRSWRMLEGASIRLQAGQPWWHGRFKIMKSVRERVKGRSIYRLAQRVASVVSWRPARRSAPIARFLSAAITLGPDRVRTMELSSRQRVSRSRQSLDRPLAADEAGEAGGGGPGRGQAGDAKRGDVG